MNIEDAIKYYKDKSYKCLIHGASTHFSVIKKDAEKSNRYRQIQKWLEELVEWRTGKRKFEKQ
jgi:hypothetical protein